MRARIAHPHRAHVYSPRLVSRVTECRFVRLSTYVPPKGETCAAVRCMYANASVSGRAKVHRALKHDARIVDLSHRACETFLSCCFLIRNFRSVLSLSRISRTHSRHGAIFARLISPRRFPSTSGFSHRFLCFGETERD